MADITFFQRSSPGLEHKLQSSTIPRAGDYVGAGQVRGLVSSIMLDYNHPTLSPHVVVVVR